ncbi:hypothetical protein [Kangiella sp. HZ709]|uniref:hypothetical protein n=1 Tax=Kangiella sp. HZ709 TaxID=2666328 RepID=UPI0018A2224E|nr:hypothetical protein [Kangiella sp. HZ709]
MTNKDKKDIWIKTRELLLFQLKLFADAARDLLLSPVAIVCYILDLSHDGPKKDSHFEKLMAFGRRTDHHINLFKHSRSYKKGMMTVDDAAQVVEDTLVNELKTGQLTEKGINAVKEALKNRFNSETPKDDSEQSSSTDSKLNPNQDKQ